MTSPLRERGDRTMKVTELQSLSDWQMEDMKDVLGELSKELHVKPEILISAIENPGTHVFALLNNDERIIGTATLCILELPTGRTAHVEAVVIKAVYRGQGLGRMLMEHVIDYAHFEFPGVTIHLTSNPNRVAANELYKRLGFKKSETNVYRMKA